MNKPAAARITAFAITAILIVSSFCVAANAASAHPFRILDGAGASATYGHDLRHPHAKRTRNAHKVRKHARAHKAQATANPTQHPTTNPTQHPTTNPTQNPTSNPTTTTTHVPALMEADDNNCTADNVVPFMQAHQATILRMVITPVHLADASGLACIQKAEAPNAACPAGCKIYLSVQYDPHSTNAELRSYFAQVISVYGQPWAISIGNEEPLDDSPTFTYTPDDYVADWDAVEPTIKADAPDAILVAGEADPWHANWDAAIADDQPVGADAVSFHCYQMAWSGGNTAGGQGGQGGGSGLDDVPALAAEAKADGYPLWCSEMAPRTDPTGAGFVQLQTLDQWQAANQATFDQAPGVTMQAWYEWPSIGATTPGI